MDYVPAKVLDKFKQEKETHRVCYYSHKPLVDVLKLITQSGSEFPPTMHACPPSHSAQTAY